MNNKKLVEQLKKYHGFESDTALAEHLNVDRRVVYNFKQREGENNIQKQIILDLWKVRIKK